MTRNSPKDCWNRFLQKFRILRSFLFALEQDINFQSSIHIYLSSIHIFLRWILIYPDHILIYMG